MGVYVELRGFVVAGRVIALATILHRDWPRTSRVRVRRWFPYSRRTCQSPSLLIRSRVSTTFGIACSVCWRSAMAACWDVGSCEEGAQVIFAEKASLAIPTGGEHDRVGGILSPDVDVPHFVSHQTLRSTRFGCCCFGYRRCPRFVPSGFDFRHRSCHRLQRGRRTNTQSRKIVPTKMRISITTSMSNAYALRSGWSSAAAPPPEDEHPEEHYETDEKD